VDAEGMDILEEAFNSAVNVALEGIRLGSQDVRGVSALFEEVPDIGRAHLLEELAPLVLSAFLFLLFLSLSLALLALGQVCLNDLSLLFNSFTLETIKHYVVFNVLYNM
jgi:hypothetical protein